MITIVIAVVRLQTGLATYKAVPGVALVTAISPLYQLPEQLLQP